MTSLSLFETHYFSTHSTTPDPLVQSLLLPHYSFANFLATGLPQPFLGSTISTIPPDGWTITAAGEYLVEGCIKWEASDPSAVAISVASNNVTLHFLPGATIHCLAGGVGIKADNASGLNVVGGKIAQPSLFGISISGGLGVTIEGTQVCGVRNEDPAVLCAGILAVECLGITVNGAQVSKICATGTTVAGIATIACVPAVVENCKVNHLTNRAGACAGIMTLLSALVAIRDNCVTHLKTLPGVNLNTVGHTCIGILPTDCVDMEIARNRICHVAGSCDDAHGISVFASIPYFVGNTLVDKCHVFDISTGNWGAKSSAKTTGIEIYTSGTEVRDCTAKRIMAKCPGDRQCTGFSVSSADGVLFLRCQAEYVRVSNLSGRESVCKYGYGAGFGWAPDPRELFRKVAINVTYRACCAKYCQVGFDTWYHQDSTWISPRSIYNDRAVWNCSRRKRRLNCNLCSECPTPIGICLTNLARGNTIRGLRTKKLC